MVNDAGRYYTYLCTLTQAPEDGRLVYEGNDPHRAMHPKVDTHVFYTTMIWR